MSANVPPPQQPAPGQNPYAQQPPAGPYAPQAPQAPAPSPYGAPQQPGAFDPAAYPPPAPFAQPAPLAQRPGNPALGVLAAVGAALVAALLYGLIIKGTKHEIGYAAVAVGAVVGLALGKIGGRNPALPIIGVPIALLGVYLGQLFGIALLVDSTYHIGVVNIFTHHFHDLQQTWKEAMNGMDFVFFGIAGLEGFVITRRVARG
ncbi:hypothetical protein V2S66_07380 [Streptomyces sp. V4-01]|uniref:Uncharacterized protein n=1 Tax=Actinacidiphila polyblastidii TaxID=3110430 RepID=A0ABU7P7J8_9ACTN|nr:hypothetical protein [Streptomyces sp. V4-01]